MGSGDTEVKAPLLGPSSERRSQSDSSYGTVPKQRIESRSRTQISKRDIILIGVILLVACITIIVTLVVGLPKIHQKKLEYFNTTLPISSSPLVSFDNAVVITDAQACGIIGKEALMAGGSAVDAALAMLFCGGVVNPQSMGLGGGFFMTIYNRATNTSVVIDGRETAPENSTVDMFHSNASLSTVGGMAIAVPGELRGYWLAHQKYGKLNWSSLIEPSAKLCREGFSVSSHLAGRLAELKNAILAEPTMKEVFYNNETGDVYKEGELLKRPVLAKTLERVANGGADVLYTGDLATQLVNDIEEFGGIISLNDMKNYEAKVRVPVSMKLKNHVTLHSVPPPGSGAVLASILNILDGYNITSDSLTSAHDTLLMFHRMMESFKYSFAKRTHLGDEDFVNITQFVQTMTLPSYGANMRRMISDTETLPEIMYGANTYGLTEDHGTAQVSVVAPNGDAVSATSSLNTQFGCMRISRSTGIILNSNMDDFSSPNITNYFGLPPSPANFIVPGKRPMSSMSPAIFVDANGNVTMVLGGAGGTRIITATALVASSILWLNRDIKQAIDAPRIHHQLHPNTIQYEKAFPQMYLDGLKQIYGHESIVDTQRSVILGILREATSGRLKANVDHRKGGIADGF